MKIRAYISFCGLYSTYLAPSDLLESFREYERDTLADMGFSEEERLEYWDACDSAFDFCDYAQKAGARWTESYENLLTERPGLENVRLEFDSVDSPREYNFTTDACAVRISAADLRRVRKYAETIARRRTDMDDCEELAYLSADERNDFCSFADYVSERMRPRDGFMPFYSNDVRDWGAVREWGEAQLELLFDFVLPEREVVGLDYVDEDLISDCEAFARFNDPDPREWLTAYRAEKAAEENEEE